MPQQWEKCQYQEGIQSTTIKVLDKIMRQPLILFYTVPVF